MNTTRFTGSRHFDIHPLAEGIFAAIAKDGGAAICNAGLIDLGGQLLVFDTFLTPQAALDLRRFAIDTFGRAPQIVINSHCHNDHIWGNQVFAADAQIISSGRTRELIATSGMEELQWYSANAAQKLDSLRVQLQTAGDERQQEQLMLWIGYYEGLVEALPQLTVRLPGITFNSRLEMHGAMHNCELITFEGAHSGSDTILHLSQEGIIFMGDLLFVGAHPYLADGDAQRLLNVLREISRMDATCYVPGHGPVGSIEDLKVLIEYIEQCFETAHALLEKGNVTEDNVKALKIAERFQHWQQPQFYRTNISFLCQRLRPANENG